MDSAVDSMEAEYDALLDAVAAFIAEPVRTTGAIQDLKNRIDAFYASCDRADDLVRAAADRVAFNATGNAHVPPPPAAAPPSPGTGTTRIDALLRAVEGIAHHDHPPLQAKAKAAAGDQHHNLS
ncbi:Os02g0829700 [Oryza sativa Japonica Group]|uniref:Os02g0829700 protein n=6 Tax=Oryza TaxID=4527 RepID=Q6K9T6_ORYSJ|nr:hypothetical protein OsI_00066 [Oryza sativa Indica Group]KAF2947800.1 hypothetical protein DAI22_02g394800 [Oryza sativa Japonica Group]BAD22942.1 hypothetical protein [Oryza sativa Japonica Group]BAS81731.1 Os02g0829700 [Oryza sativa Japonica Group]